VNWSTRTNINTLTETTKDENTFGPFCQKYLVVVISSVVDDDPKVSDVDELGDEQG
jgi:hypothetical protein